MSKATLSIPLAPFFWLFVWPLLPIFGPLIGLVKSFNYGMDNSHSYKRLPFLLFMAGFAGSVLLLCVHVLVLAQGAIAAPPTVVSTEEPKEFALDGSTYNDVRSVRVKVRFASKLEWLPYSWSYEREYVRSHSLTPAGYEIGWCYWIDVADQITVSDDLLLEKAYSRVTPKPLGLAPETIKVLLRKDK